MEKNKANPDQDLEKKCVQNLNDSEEENEVKKERKKINYGLQRC